MEMSDRSNVVSLEGEGFKKRLNDLVRSASVSDADFADAVYTSMTKFGVAEDAFRDTFGLTKGAVERWSTMKNLPQPAVRPKILEWLLTEIENGKR